MNILLDTRLVVPVTMAGGEVALHQTLKWLAPRHEIKVCVEEDKPTMKSYEGLAYFRRRTKALYDWADVVICQLDTTPTAVEFAEKTGNSGKVVHMVHTARTLPDYKVMGGPLAVFSSDYIRQRSLGFQPFDGKTMVLHPPVFAEDYRTETTREAFTLVNLSVPKGGPMFWRIAEQMPDIRFIAVVGGYFDQVLGDLPNVELVEQTPDIRSIYARTRGLLVLSLSESYGRTPVEAAASGIPSICTPCGGIRESMGEAVTYIHRPSVRRVVLWERAIRRLCLDGPWERKSAKAAARFAQLDPVSELQAFEAALEDVCARR